MPKKKPVLIAIDEIEKVIVRQELDYTEAGIALSSVLGTHVLKPAALAGEPAAYLDRVITYAKVAASTGLPSSGEKA